ncbi:BAH_G0006410.mRNA.1.CDS.1 [Saccharomyces cerevisiae]|nr:BAH_G0006410.mRNA.1.CDS.1 [Saccharomyces cerevisiae]CAI4314417.1 CCQ_1a_G0006600.mRNA.1.CDS.1 [Saccharomyces cerevisiae]CAI7058646.1 BAH_G0006410.mRNA.1.CDS.1 [Saccharomyces cerevisiae]CAI7174777.1 CCQ_1a_G0006600.mRNA.1.CDS.1 [Saccharomyces cerevisiae]
MAAAPWYIRQRDTDLLGKFKFIQNQEDGRLREATNGTVNSRWSLGVSIEPRNDARNRYVNIMPYERNRVHLKTLSGNDYINASYVKVNVPGQSIEPGYYIATQGPTRKTWDQFWQMCYHNCPLDNIVIVMVTPLVEYNREKCYQYWPRGGVDDTVRIASKWESPGGANDMTQFPSDLKIEFVNVHKVKDYYTVTDIKLTPTDPLVGPIKTVHHFYFDLWKDMNKPEEVVPIMELCAHSHSLNSRGNPIIVHCSAGVGRTGTFIALDHLMHDTLDFKNITERSRHSDRATEEYTRDLIEQIVLQLRSQRMKMVQTKDQFLFIYHAAKYLNSLSVNQ